jgi:hypothetical protein
VVLLEVDAIRSLLALLSTKGGGERRVEVGVGLFGWAVAVKKVAVGCELWKKLL